MLAPCPPRPEINRRMLLATSSVDGRVDDQDHNNGTQNDHPIGNLKACYRCLFVKPFHDLSPIFFSGSPRRGAIEIVRRIDFVAFLDHLQPLECAIKSASHAELNACLLCLSKRSLKHSRERIRCRRKLLNTIRKHQNILRTPPATTGRRPNIMRADFMRRRRTTLTRQGLTPFMQEGTLKRQ